jgi:hypothetical protein
VNCISAKKHAFPHIHVSFGSVEVSSEAFSHCICDRNMEKMKLGINKACLFFFGSNVIDFEEIIEFSG